MLNKQAIDVSFAQGLDTKTDSKRVQMGKFVQLENSVFQKGGLLQKRNGYSLLSSLPDDTYSYLTTFNGNLTAIGPNIAALNNANSSWVSRGTLEPLSLSTLPVIRNNRQQYPADIAVASNGVGCAIYTENSVVKYVIFDSVTGQNLVAPVAVPVSSGTVSGGAKVFILGANFVMVFTNTITATDHLQYVTVNIANPTLVGSNTDLAASYVSAASLSWDGFVSANKLYVAYNSTSGGQSIKMVYLTTTLAVSSTVTFAGYKATIMSVTADETTPANPTIYASFYRADTSIGFTLAVSSNLNVVMNPVLIIPSGTIDNITSVATNGICTIFYEVANDYSFASIPTHFIRSITVTPLISTFKSVFSAAAGTITASTATGLVNGMYLIDNTTPTNITAGTTFTVSGTTLTLSVNTAGNSASNPGDTMTAATVSSAIVVIRSVGLLSRAFFYNEKIYFLAAYQSNYQSTDFLINGSSSTAASPVIAAKLAYQNTNGYLTNGLGTVSLNGNVAQIPYFYKDLIQAVNKDTGVPSATQVAGVYSQVGLNLVSFAFGTEGLNTAEIGNDLHITGGFLSMYDGYLPVEHNFFLYPEVDQVTPTNTATWSATGGSMAAQPDGATNTNAYYYQFTYEWTDNQGNAFRSAPSIPIAVTTTGNGTSGSVTVNIATLRLTMKVANPIKVVIYRWSVAQQNYYQTTSITSPLLNSTTVDQVQFVDTHSDATILGNNLIYTTGGVIEDINAPASDALANFNNRLWLIDAENPNNLWYSKQVIPNTPVEMSDLFTVFVSPTVATQGATGPNRTIYPMDDKLIIGKRNAFLYINGTGPDNTGANNQYSEPIFITSTVGCENQRSLVLTPNGLMFQSHKKGIWILDRGLNTNYIGAPVEEFMTGATVTSAVNIPDTNQIRFTLDTGITLMYDYYYDQWGTFTGVPAVSSCIFENMHTFINENAKVYQETANSYLDGSNPVQISFQTGPLRLGDLQNYQRAYFFYLLGTYYSPHKLNVSIFYDYSSSPSQSVLVSPVNFSSVYGSSTYQSPYGQGNPYGGETNLENWRVFLESQRCMAFAIKVNEIFDPSYDTQAGAGLTLSGLNVVMGMKKGFRPQNNQTSVG